MKPYVPGVFLALYETKLGLELWRFLNEREAIIRMESATALARPAVEALEEPLLDRFGEHVLERRVKQMIGHMVRQIMERRGYIIDVQDVKVTNGAPFSRATRYKLPEDMTFHVFLNSARQRVFGLTAEKSGTRLPTDYPSPGVRWSYWKSFRGALRGRVAFGLDDEKKAREDIRRQGYHIYEMKRVLRSAH